MVRNASLDFAFDVDVDVDVDARDVDLGDADDAVSNETEKTQIPLQMQHLEQTLT